MRRDFREAFRRLAQHPSLSISTATVLACAFAAVAVVVAVADAVLLRPLPYPETDRVVVLWEGNPRQQTLLELSYPNFLDWRTVERQLR